MINNTTKNEALVTRNQVISAMRILYDTEEIGFYPLGASTVTDIKDIDTGEYKRTILFCGFNFYTRAGLLYSNMKKRCRLGNTLRKGYHAYVGCFVSEEWLNSFDDFSNWCRSQIGYFQRDECGNFFTLDSDLLANGVKSYGKETSTFLPMIINAALSGNGCLGYTETNGKYRAQMTRYGKAVCLGTFNTAKQASAAYKKARRLYIRELAKKYKHQLSVEAFTALMAYKQA